MPRPYKLGQRQVTSDQTRARILAAARELLGAEGGVAGFTMDAVAKQAGVARMTVYHRFESKVGLLEALCDDLAVRGGIEGLMAAFSLPDPLDALAEFVTVLARFWESDRKVLLRLHGLAALDPDFERVLEGRQGRRREGLRFLVGRIAERHGRPKFAALEETVGMLNAVISYETFHTLAGPQRGFEEVAPLVLRIARATLGLEGAGHP